MSILNGQTLLTSAMAGLTNTYSTVMSKHSTSGKGLTLKDLNNVSSETVLSLGGNTSFLQYLTANFNSLDSDGDGEITGNDLSNLMSNASQLMGYSDRASNFHSTLWFSDADKEKNIPEIILACGQFSICYEIYRWSLSHKGNQTNIRKVHGQLKSDKMRKKLKQDWGKFKESPNWMIDLKKIN